MPAIIEIDDRDRLHRFFAERGPDPYALANLDELFWPRGRWWGLEENGRLGAVAGTITGVFDRAILYALAPPRDPSSRLLLEAIAKDLPDRMLGLLPLGVTLPGFSDQALGPQRQMILAAAPRSDPDVVEVGPADQERILAFLKMAYSGAEEDLRAFEPYMIERWPHVALLLDEEIVAFAGTHVLTERYSAAALGNIVTSPAHRGQGFACRLVSSLCSRLRRQGIDRIGLNVAEANRPARRCYERIGFAYGQRFRECLLSR